MEILKLFQNSKSSKEEYRKELLRKAQIHQKTTIIHLRRKNIMRKLCGK